MPGMRHEIGTHRVQRIPGNDRRGRVHSSTVTVSLMDAAVAQAATLDDRDLSIRWYSGTGAGGQHRNRHLNSIELTHVPTGVSRSAQTRSRENSMASAREALTRAVSELCSGAAAAARNDGRRSQIGNGGRGERNRLWRFRDDVVTDDDTGLSTSCSRAMRGGLDALWPSEDRPKRRNA
jgi:peptide chain release factor 1